MRNSCHGVFNPRLRIFENIRSSTPLCGDDWTDHYLNFAGSLDETATWPELPRIVRNRHNRVAGLFREDRTTNSVAPFFTRSYTCAFWKYHHPTPIV